MHQTAHIEYLHYVDPGYTNKHELGWVLQVDRLAAEVLWREAKDMLQEVEPVFHLLQVSFQLEAEWAPE